MICESDFDTCMAALFKRVGEGTMMPFLLFLHCPTGKYRLYQEDDESQKEVQKLDEEWRPILWMTGLQLFTLLSAPLRQIYKEVFDAVP